MKKNFEKKFSYYSLVDNKSKKYDKNYSLDRDRRREDKYKKQYLNNLLMEGRR